jgi:hypothetical protein
MGILAINWLVITYLVIIFDGPVKSIVFVNTIFSVIVWINFYLRELVTNHK